MLGVLYGFDLSRKRWNAEGRTNRVRNQGVVVWLLRQLTIFRVGTLRIVVVWVSHGVEETPGGVLRAEDLGVIDRLQKAIQNA